MRKIFQRDVREYIVGVGDEEEETKTKSTDKHVHRNRVSTVCFD